MKISFVCLVVALLVSSCIKRMTDPLLDKFNPNYTIQGTLYAEDGVTPAPSRILVLQVHSPFSLIGYGADADFSQIVTTDKYGKYNFTYPTLDINANATLAISPHPDELPSSGMFLKNIPIHKNIERDICDKPFSKLNVNFNISFSSKTDTFFFYTPIFIFTDGKEFENIVGFNTLLLHAKSLTNYTFKGEADSDANSFLPTYQWYVIAKGREEFKNLSTKISANDSPNYVINQEVKRFPETTEWTIKYVSP